MPCGISIVSEAPVDSDICPKPRKALWKARLTVDTTIHSFWAAHYKECADWGLEISNRPEIRCAWLDNPNASCSTGWLRGWTRRRVSAPNTSMIVAADKRSHRVRVAFLATLSKRTQSALRARLFFGS